MSTRRALRLNDLIREELSDLIRRELRDPRVKGVISITTVELTTDYHYARVYVSALGGEAERLQATEVLNGAAGFLRRGLGSRLHIRHIPELEFRADDSLERGDRIISLLRDIKSEGESPTDKEIKGSGAADESEPTSSTDQRDGGK